MDFGVLDYERDVPGEDGGGEDIGGVTGFADEARPDVIEPEDVGQEDPGVAADPGRDEDSGTVRDVSGDAPPADAIGGDEKVKATGGGCVSAGTTGASRTGVLVIFGLLGIMAAAFRRRRA